MHGGEAKVGGAGLLGRVLVVDDDPALRRVCARTLGHEGWEVVLAEDGRDAIAAMDRNQEPFDCVVSDVNMPELDGFGLVAAIRKHDDDLPVLLMTGDPSLDGAVRAIDSGAVSYLSKPFEHETLVAAVARAARRHGVARMRRRADSFATKLHLDNLPGKFTTALERAWMAFQPIIDVRTKQIYAYEALLRTDEPSLGRVDILIATAERLDRVHELGRVVRDRVARAAVDLPDGALLFVNVHGLELNDEELYTAANPLAPMAERVVLEITERTGIEPEVGASRAAMLRRAGYRIAVDDLGAGYAALGALASLEPDVVKLDMSLIRNLDQHLTKRRVVGAITTLCHELGSKVVAEGVETVQEEAAVMEAGVDLIQGYLYARPTRGFARL